MTQAEHVLDISISRLIAQAENEIRTEELNTEAVIQADEIWEAVR